MLWISLLLGFLASLPEYGKPLSPEVPRWSVWVLMAFVFGLWAVVTLFIARRRNWARILTLISFVFGLAYWLWDYRALAERPIYLLAIDFIDTTLTALALYWLFTGTGAIWFKVTHSHAL
jgi:hypothetical protein